MKTALPQYFIGWDVGAWDCDKNRRSRDAVVILDGACNLIGKPFRGNLRNGINLSNTARSWTATLFESCQLPPPTEDAHITMAIDAPLGFPRVISSLAGTPQKGADCIERGLQNPYLYRDTERLLGDRNFKPLSSMRDMLGSQATKAMHAMAKFSRRLDGETGIWSLEQLTAIETYPTACKMSPLVRAKTNVYSDRDWFQENNKDKQDALFCAMLASLFHLNRDLLYPPPASVDVTEGWIWIPKDAFGPPSTQRKID